VIVQRPTLSNVREPPSIPQTDGVLEARDTSKPLDELAESPKGDWDSFKVAGGVKDIDCELALTEITLETAGDAS
jgi:hypothetical protein